MDTIFIKAGSYIFIIILAYALKKMGLFGEKDQDTVMKLIMKITLPAAVVSGFSHFERDTSLIMVTVLGLVMNIIMSGIGYLLVLRKSKEDKAFNIINYAGYNIGTFAMPYLQSFLGNMGIIVACLFDAGNAIMCTGVTYAVASEIAGQEKSTYKEFLKKIFSSVPFDVYLILLFCYFTNIHLPQFIFSIASPIGNANPFLAMFMIGLSFDIILGKSVLKDVGITLLIRYLVSGIVAYGVYMYLPFGIEVRKVIALIVFAPMSALNVINSIRCNGSKEKAGLINSLSILISLIIMTCIIISWNL